MHSGAAAKVPERRAATVAAPSILRRLAPGGMLAIAGQGMNSAGNFLVTVMMARALSPEGFGAYSLLFATSITINGFINTIIAEPVRTLGVGGEPSLRARYAGAQLLAAAALGGAVALLVCTGAMVGWHVGLGLALGVGCTILVTAIFETARALAAARLLWARVLLADCVSQIGKLAVLCSFFTAGSISLATAFWAIAGTGLLGALSLYRLGIRAAIPPRSYWLTQLRTHARFGKWLALEGVVYVLSTQLYLYLVAAYVDVSSAGAFNAAQSLVNAVNVLWMGGTSFAISTSRAVLIRDGADAWRRWLFRSGRRLLGAVALLLLIISVTAGPLMSAIYSARLAQYAYVVPILTVAALMMAANSLLGAAFRSLEMPQIGFRSKAISALVTLLISIPLVRRFGIAGAAGGFIVTQACWTAVYALALRAIRTDWMARIERIRAARPASSTR